MTTNIDPPEFALPNDDNDSGRYEIWCLRAPAHFDVHKILDGATLDVDTNLLRSGSSFTTSQNPLLSKFKSDTDGKDYSLVLADGVESENMRLLTRDPNDGDKLIASGPFKGQIHLTSVMNYSGSNVVGDTNNVQTDLLLAPSKDRAPKPAFDQVGNGAVATIRLAYVPVFQREGLKRRWAMPGSDAVPAASVAAAPPKRSKTEEAVVSDDDASGEGKGKKEKKVKKKKHKKTPKK
mmetsp:Transcript_27856/g.55689  ORF Transcript_27856/g.55689 Transcript_27856/m.55689 type:complete len:236 (-) Transcript_27856:155-862(-)